MALVLLLCIVALLVWLELLDEANVALRERCGILALLLKDAQRCTRNAQQAALDALREQARFRTLEEMAVDDIIESTKGRTSADD